MPKDQDQPEGAVDVSSTRWLGEVGKPDTTPQRSNVYWEHPRVVAAVEELHAAAEAYAVEKQKLPRQTSWSAWTDCCNRLENAARRYSDTVREYTIS
jgi:hypothetical protein